MLRRYVPENSPTKVAFSKEMRKEMTKAMNDIHHGHTKYNNLLKQARQEI